MSGAPPLGHKEIAEQIDRLYRHERKRHLIAFHGIGEEQVVRTVHAGEFRVVPVRSELELRARMPPLEDAEARIAFLIPWSTELPLDLAGRFVKSGKILRIGREARLARLFGVSEIEEEARRSRLADYLLAGPPARSMAAPAGRLTAAAMWSAWLGAAWRVEVSGGLGLDTLLGWAALDERGARFVEAMRAPDATGVREDLLAHLAAQLGPAAPAVWRAWESGQGRATLEMALLFEALAGSEHAGVRMWVKLAARTALGITDEAAALGAAKALGQAAGAALRHVERRGGEGAARAILRAADGRVDDAEVREALVESPRFPSSWQRRLEVLGRRLLEGAAAPSSEAVERADEARRFLERHALFQDEAQTRVGKRAEMAVRLLSWLTARPDERLAIGRAPYAEAEALARWYAEEGGFVDLARRWTRGSAEGDFGKGAQAVVEAADAARQALDRRFAASLAAWVEAGRPAAQVLPIDHAVRRVAVRFLEEEPSRKLLVLLIDGMAWAQAVELLQSLENRSAPWGLLAWHASAKGRIGEAPVPVVLANLPTLTEVSRAAFFTGKPVPVGASGDTGKDVDRWRENVDIGKLLPPPEVPRLLLRAEGHTREGSASEEALRLVGDATRRVVALVINAIDASLKGDPQERHAWTADSVWSLPDLLEKAREAGRAVLMASDHGHVPADRLQSLGALPDKGGARWRVWWSERDPLREGEVGLRAGSGVWAPKGAHGVALLADDAARWGGAAHAGEHGGASLAEVVAPCVLIGCEDLVGAGTDKALSVQPHRAPPWWRFDLRAPRAGAEPVAEPRPPRAPKRSPSGQLSLPALAPPAPEPPREPPRVEAPPPHATPSAFARSEILAARAPSAALRQQAAQAVDFLLARRGVASEEAFAAAMGEITWRARGLIARLQEVLNVDGYQVLRLDPATRQVYLDREMLAQQFEVTL